MISTKAIPPEVFKPQGGLLLWSQIHFSQYGKFVFAFYGGLEEIRTPDPHNANVVRSQLRYKPISQKLYCRVFSLSRKKKSLYTISTLWYNKQKTVRRKQYVPWRRLPWLFFEYHWFGRTVRPCNFAVTAIHMPAATKVRVAASFIN